MGAPAWRATPGRLTASPGVRGGSGSETVRSGESRRTPVAWTKGAKVAMGRP